VDGVSLLQDGLAVLPQLSRFAEMNGSRGHQTKPGMMVLKVAPGKEHLRPAAGIQQTAEASGIGGLIFHGLELRFRKGIVILLS
jgi:hypothetical protein